MLGRLTLLRTRSPLALLVATLALTVTPTLASGVEYDAPPEDYARYEGQDTCVKRARPGRGPVTLDQLPVWAGFGPLPGAEVEVEPGLEALLGGLNPEQRKAVTHGDGPMLRPSLRPVCGFLVLLLVGALHGGERIDPAVAKADADLLWYDIKHLDLEGQGWTDTKAPYDRLPERAEKRPAKDPLL